MHRLLEYPTATLARIMYDHLTEMDRRGIEPTTSLRALRTADGPVTTTQTLDFGQVPQQRRVRVAACARLDLPASTNASCIYHRLLLIPGTFDVWHFTRSMPAEGTQLAERLKLTRLNVQALELLLSNSRLRTPLTLSYAETTEVD